MSQRRISSSRAAPSAEHAAPSRRRRRCGLDGGSPSPAATARRTRSPAPTGPRDRPLDVLMAPKWGSAAAASTSAAIASRPGTGAPARSPEPPAADAPAVADRARTRRACRRALAHDLAGDLADQVVIGRHLAADDRQPEPPTRVDRDHARIAAQRVAGEQHARHEASTISWIVTPIAGSRPVAQVLAVAGRRSRCRGSPSSADTASQTSSARAPTGSSPAGRRRWRSRCPRRRRSSGPPRAAIAPRPTAPARSLPRRSICSRTLADRRTASRRRRPHAPPHAAQRVRAYASVDSANPGGTPNPASSSSPSAALLPPNRGSSARSGRPARGAVRPLAGSRLADDGHRPGRAVDPDQLPGADRAVARPVPTTAGSPYSRQTIAAWDITPPMSVTVALIFGKIGAHAGEVEPHTRISPSSTSPI